VRQGDHSVQWSDVSESLSLGIWVWELSTHLELRDGASGPGSAADNWGETIDLCQVLENKWIS
jgi:hypothetical protein